MATVLSCGQNGGRPTLKALQGQRALARGHVDFGEVRRTELHPPDEVSRSVLCTQTQTQARHSGVPYYTNFTLPMFCFLSVNSPEMSKVPSYIFLAPLFWKVCANHVVLEIDPL